MMKHSTLLSACRHAGICLVLLLSAHASHGQMVKTIELNYSEKDFKYTLDDDGCLTISSIYPAFRYSEDINAPSLPVRIVNVLIAPDQEFSSVSYSGHERIVKAGIKILPNPYIATTNDTVAFRGHRCTDYEKEIYPVSCAEYAGTGIMDGFKIVSIVVCPFKYNTQENTLSFIDNFTLNVKLLSQKATKATKATGDIMEDVVRGLVINGTELDILYAQQRAQARAMSQRSCNDTIDYLIITNDTLAPGFTPLVRWKKQKGVRTEVKTVESIYSEYTNSSWRNQLKIKHCIEDYKNQKHTRFVLLGGDVEIVPIQKCYSECYSSTRGLCKEMIPADVFYASFDFDFGWDQNGNGIIGEGIYCADGVDLRPDINLTRISVSTLEDVNAFVYKTITYEKNPPISSWKNRVLFAGAMTYNMYVVNNRDMSDSEYEGNMLYTQHFINKWNGTRTRYYDTWSDILNGAIGVTASGLQTLLADGYSFVDISSHGSSGKWWLDSLSCYYKYAADTLSSSQPFLITTNACETNWFDTEYPGSYCLSEAFLRNPNSGVVAYLGSSRYGWGHGVRNTPPNNLGTSDWLNSIFYDSLFSSSAKTKHFGEMITRSKSNLNLQDVYTSPRWLLYSVNPMGDCEMPIYTSTPKTFNSVNLRMSLDSLTIISWVDGCRFCVMDLDNDNGYYQIVDNDYRATFTSLPRHYSICITKQDYAPYYKEINHIQDSSGTYYIQNEIFSEKNVLTGLSDVMIGSDVTSQKEEGPVVTETNSTTIESTGTITIMKDFEVKQGAEFKILNK